MKKPKWAFAFALIGAIVAIGRFEQQAAPAVRVLARAQGDRDGSVRDAAKDALKKVTSDDAKAGTR